MCRSPQIVQIQTIWFFHRTVGSSKNQCDSLLHRCLALIIKLFRKVLKNFWTFSTVGGLVVPIRQCSLITFDSLETVLFFALMFLFGFSRLTMRRREKNTEDIYR